MVAHMSIDQKHAWIDHIQAHKKLKLFQPKCQAEIRQMRNTMSHFLARTPQ